MIESSKNGTAKRAAPGTAARKPRPARKADADPALVEAFRRQVEAARAAAATVESNRDPVGLLTAGVLNLCAAAYPDATGARLVIENAGAPAVELMLPVSPALVADPDAVTTARPTPRELRARLRAWLARTLGEIHAVQQELGDPNSALTTSLPCGLARDIGSRLSQAWGTIAFNTALEPPAEFPGLPVGD